MTVWIDNGDTAWSREGAIFDDYADAEATAKDIAHDRGDHPDDLLAALTAVEIETADASEIEDVRREMKSLDETWLRPETRAAISQRYAETHDD